MGSTEMDKLKYPQWQVHFEDAISESNPAQLALRVVAAEEALFLRLQRLGRDPATPEELTAIENALATLRMLKKNKLGYPDWNAR